MEVSLIFTMQKMLEFIFLYWIEKKKLYELLNACGLFIVHNNNNWRNLFTTIIALKDGYKKNTTIIMQ